ncbi:MAG: hypothetical protein ABI860_03040, partial [Gemmatimonadales bacterium]
MRPHLRPTLVSLAFLSASCGGDLTLPGPGDPASLRIVAGNLQTGLPGEMIPDPLVVELLDGSGQPVAGRAVSFRFTDDFPEAAVDPNGPATDAQGRASAVARLGQQEGTQAIEALVATPGEDLRVRFSLTALIQKTGGDGNDGGGGAATPPPPPGGGSDHDGGGAGPSDDGGSVAGGGKGKD